MKVSYIGSFKATYKTAITNPYIPTSSVYDTCRIYCSTNSNIAATLIMFRAIRINFPDFIIRGLVVEKESILEDIKTSLTYWTTNPNNLRLN